MSLLSKLYQIFLFQAAIFLLLFCACSSGDRDDMTPSSIEEIATSNHYINFSIVVSSGIESTTRADATPAGGEKGDGYEAGLGSENLVKGITIMLYKDDVGINTTRESTIDFVRYYDVDLVTSSSVASGGVYDDKTDEAVYTTGDQPLRNTGIDLKSEYHVIIVANKDLTKEITQKTTTVKDVREKVSNAIYTSPTNGIGIDVTNFVMTSETDVTVDFADLENQEIKGNKIYFKFDNMRIERLAARVDFWTKGASYVDNYNNNEGISGYVYPVVNSQGGESRDKFVLTSVTPFNLYDGEEYYIKKINIGGEIEYLADETTTSFVIDPRTGKKDGKNPDYYLNTLANLVKDDNFQANAGKYRQETKSLHDNIGKDKSQKASFTGIGDYDNFILCYPKENTLMLASPLYYYATGVAIEGYYHRAASNTMEHCVYYGFLRHQAEPFDNGDTHIIKMAEDLKPDDDFGSDLPMNFGVVRNNIYRISIDRIESKGILMQIEVKKWDKFTHETIFM